VLLAGIGGHLTEIALALFGLQLFCASIVLTLSFRGRGPAPPPHVPA
jgi:hypothetical protein